jgi:hypothetical protein
MTAAQDLRLLLDDYTEMVTNLDLMIARLDEEIGSLLAEVTTITDGAMGGAQDSLDVRLEAKRVANGWQSILTYYTSTEITDWAIYGYNGTPIDGPGDFVRENDHSFSFSGMSIPTFKTGTKVKCQAGDIERTIISQNRQNPVAAEPGPDPPAAPGVPGYVIVNLDPGEAALPNPLITVEKCTIVYAYDGTGWDSDAGIIADQYAFEVGYDQINAPIDLNGTYGLIARYSNVSVGRGVQVLNRNKYQQFVTLYEPYAAS